MLDAFDYILETANYHSQRAIYDYSQAQYCLDKLKSVDTSDTAMREHHLQTALASLREARRTADYLIRLYAHARRVVDAQAAIVSHELERLPEPDSLRQ